jgi:hypothetical protein
MEPDQSADHLALLQILEAELEERSLMVPSNPMPVLTEDHVEAA